MSLLVRCRLAAALHSAPCYLLLGKARSLHGGPSAIAAAVTLTALRDSVAKTGAGNRSLYSLCPARAVTSAGARRQIEGT